MFGNGCSTIQSWKDTVPERIACAHGGSRTAVRHGCPRVMRPGCRAHMARIDGLYDILCVRSVIGSDQRRCFGGLLGENGWRKGKCVEISAFCYNH